MRTVLLVWQFCTIQLVSARAAPAGHTKVVHANTADIISTAVHATTGFYPASWSN